MIKKYSMSETSKIENNNVDICSILNGVVSSTINASKLGSKPFLDLVITELGFR